MFVEMGIMMDFNQCMYDSVLVCDSSSNVVGLLILSMFGCRVDESQLTGEADDVLKDAIEDPLLLSGSKVLEGNGRALVIAVGSNSQAGIIANLARGPGDNPGLRSAYCPSVIANESVHSTSILT